MLGSIPDIRHTWRFKNKFAPKVDLPNRIFVFRRKQKNSFWFHTHSRNVQCVVRRGGEFGSGRNSEFGSKSLWVVNNCMYMQLEANSA